MQGLCWLVSEIASCMQGLCWLVSKIPIYMQAIHWLVSKIPIYMQAIHWLVSKIPIYMQVIHWLVSKIASCMQYCKPSFFRSVLISRFIYWVLIRGVLYSWETCFYTWYMCKIPATNMFTAFNIRDLIVLANVAKIKRSRIKDGLQYIDWLVRYKNIYKEYIYWLVRHYYVQSNLDNSVTWDYDIT